MRDCGTGSIVTISWVISTVNSLPSISRIVNSSGDRSNTALTPSFAWTSAIERPLSASIRWPRESPARFAGLSTNTRVSRRSSSATKRLLNPKPSNLPSPKNAWSAAAVLMKLKRSTGLSMPSSGVRSGLKVVRKASKSSGVANWLVSTSAGSRSFQKYHVRMESSTNCFWPSIEHSAAGPPSLDEQAATSNADRITMNLRIGTPFTLVLCPYTIILSGWFRLSLRNCRRSGGHLRQNIPDLYRITSTSFSG